MLDSRPTDALPPTNVTWPFSDFFQKIFWLLETSKKRCLTVDRWSRDLRPLSRDRSATFFKISPNRLKRRKNVVWQSADGRVTSTTDAWPFSDFFQNSPKSLETSKKRCLTVGRRSRDLRPLSRDRSATFFQNFPKSLETSKKRCLTIGRQSRDLRPLPRDRSATFFKKFSNCLKRPKKRCLTVGRRSRDLNHCRVTVQRLFSKFSQIAWYVQKRCLTVGRRSRDLNNCRVTVQRLFSKFSQIAWNVQKTLFDSRPTVAWPPTTVTWPFSDFFQKNF